MTDKRTEKRDELVEAIEQLLAGVTYGDALEALLDIAAAVIVGGASDQGAADRVTASAARALAQRVVLTWGALNAPAPTAEGTGTLQ